MPSIYNLKPKFQQLLMPVMNRLAQQGVTPNHVTWAAITLSGLGGWLVWQSPNTPLLLLSIPIILFVRMALNAIDGMLARIHQMASPQGEILNEVGDILSDAVLYLPLITWFYFSIGTVLGISVFVLFASLTEFCGVLAKAMTGVRRYEGPMGKSDRAFVIGILCLLLYFSPELLIRFAGLLFWILNLMLALSCMNRLKAILKGTAS